MRLTLLGTGNAAGVPLYGCSCDHCVRARANVQLQRSPCSALLEVNGRRYLLDAGQTDLCEKFPSGTLDGIFLTHFHPDHVQGLFHLRWGVGVKIPVYAPPDAEGCADLYKHPGILQFRPQEQFTSFAINDLRITPLPLIHSKPTFGYLVEHENARVAYLTDTKGLPPKTRRFLAGQPLSLMVIDCSFVPGSEKKGHNNLDDVLEIASSVHPQTTVLTHIGHDLDVWLSKNHHKLPPDVLVGRDLMPAFP